MSKDLLPVAFNALAAVVLLGATLAYVAPLPDELNPSAAVGAAEKQWVPECEELAHADCADERADRSDEDEERDDDGGDDDEDEDRSGKGKGNGKP